MPPIVIPQALQVICSGETQGQPWANVWGTKTPPNWLISQSVANEIGEEFRVFYNSLRALTSTNWVMDSIVVRDLRTSTAPSFDVNFTAFSGTNTSNALPPQLAMVLSHQTGRRGKSYRGRTYLSGFCEDANEPDGSIQPGTVSGVLNLVAALKTGLAGTFDGGQQLAVLSRKLLEANAITSTTADDEWDRQDRRKRR